MTTNFNLRIVCERCGDTEYFISYGALQRFARKFYRVLDAEDPFGVPYHGRLAILCRECCDETGASRTARMVEMAVNGLTGRVTKA